MKLNVTLDLENLWVDGDSLAHVITEEIKNAISRAVATEVKAATKDVLGDYHKEIKAAAKEYGAKVLKDLVAARGK